MVGTFVDCLHPEPNLAIGVLAENNLPHPMGDLGNDFHICCLKKSYSWKCLIWLPPTHTHTHRQCPNLNFSSSRISFLACAFARPVVRPDMGATRPDRGTVAMLLLCGGKDETMLWLHIVVCPPARQQAGIQAYLPGPRPRSTPGPCTRLGQGRTRCLGRQRQRQRGQRGRWQRAGLASHWKLRALEPTYVLDIGN